jgi:hypothetical protein
MRKILMTLTTLVNILWIRGASNIFYFSAEDLETEAQCKSLTKFKDDLRKDIYEGSRNPIKGIVNLMTKGNEFGKIDLRVINESFKTLLKNLSSNEKTSETDLAELLANQFQSVPYCMDIAGAANMIFRMLQYKMIENQKIFLSSFLKATEKAFQMQFIFYTLSNLIECDRELLTAIAKTYYESSDTLIDEFVLIYDQILQLHNEKRPQFLKKMYRDAFNVVVRDGQAYLGVFLLYQLKGFMVGDLGEAPNWIIDNYFLVQVGAFLTVMTKDLRTLKGRQTVENLKSEFSKWTDILKTTDLYKQENGFSTHEHTAANCQTCRAVSIAEKNKNRIPV